uniref:DHFR domain-containing protein n=1 Tax=Florenciella sp. virus SA2 TaxID=3240092 RepID=A0AB39J770_9VIRU
MEEHISLINEIHITIINRDYECNKFFPVIDKNLFELIKTNEHIEDNYSHRIYKSINHNTDCP